MEVESESSEKIRVAVVDDHALFREGIVALLKDYSRPEVILQASNGRELIKRLDTAKKSKNPNALPEVVLLDLQMPEMDGLETTVYLQEHYPEIRILILTMHNEEQLIFNLMNKGACGFLAKDKSVDLVVEAIYSVRDLGIYVDETILRSIVRTWQKNQDLSKLKSELHITAREHEIIQHLADQKTTKEIASILNISTRTVDIHRKSIFVKTETKNTAGLILFAIKNNLLNF